MSPRPYILWCFASAAIAAVAAAGGAAAAVKVPESVQPLEHRVIVRFTDEPSSRLDDQVDKIKSRAGVLSVKPLRQLGMLVASCGTTEAQEQLLDFLNTDSEVELAVPDTLVTMHDFKAPPQEAAAEDMVTDQASRGVPGNSALCSANPACAARGLTGDCCPSSDGVTLACCSAQGPARVALKSFHGHYVVVDQNGGVTATAETIQASSTFSAYVQADGNVSFLSSFGNYLTAEPWGGVTSSRTQVGRGEKFHLVRNENFTVSLRSFAGKYMAAETWGGVFANRDAISMWEQFQMIYVPSEGQKFPNDPSFPMLWGMHHYARHDIDASEAWHSFTGEGGPGITLGVIDTGIDYKHEELKDRMWVNHKEIPGNGIDDDGNGYVDDIHGADFVNEDGDPWDDQMHGTHCSGTIAGAGNNGKGVAGMSWAGVRLMALKFLSSTGSGATSDAIKAIDYGIAHGARILSNSWGGGGSNSALRVAIERAEAAGVLFIAAAGNSGTDNDEEPQYPANYEADNIISVASSTVGGSLSSFSCYGNKTVHLAAPGSNIYSTVPGQGYEFLSGTSMATPHVSGLAALVWMYRPQLSMSEVRSVMLQSVKKQPWLTGKMTTGGMINAKNALETAWAYKPPSPPVHAPRGISFVDADMKVGTLGGVVTITAAADESDVEYYRVFFVSAAGFQLDALGDPIPATGAAKYVLEINGSIVAPEFAKDLVAVTGRKIGEMVPQLGGDVPSVVLEDIGMPEYAPKSVVWGGDVDLRTGHISGTLYVGRAKDESSVTEYHVYWRRNGTRGALLGSIPAIGFMEPRCTGPACKLIESTVTSAGVYRFNRGPYTDEESAIIEASGPGNVTVRSFSSEQYYDWLSVGTTRLTGDMADSMPVLVELPAGPVSITWFTDSSIDGDGWSFDLVQTGAQVSFKIVASAPLADSIEVVPAYRKTERSQGVVVQLVDYDEDMPPSPAFVPSALSFDDFDPAEGEVAGVAKVTPTAGAKVKGGVTFYHVSFADEAGRSLGKGWNSTARGDAVLKVNITPTAIPSGATQLIGQAGNAHGLSTGYASLPLTDVVPTEPGNATWTGDSDGRRGFVAGTITVEPAASQAGIVKYVAYWSTDGHKLAKIGEQPPSSWGGSVTFVLPRGTRLKSDEVLVVSAYVWGEMSTGSFADVEDEEESRRLEEQPPGSASAAATTAAPGAAAPGPGHEPWLHQLLPQGKDKSMVAWSAEGEDAAIAAAAGPGRIRCSITVPGLEAAFAAKPLVRAAFSRALAAALPVVEETNVRVMRILAVTQARAARVVPGGRRLAPEVSRALGQHPDAAAVQLEIHTPAGGPPGALDQVEAKLILLSIGGGAAQRFDAALASELQAAGAATTFGRSRVSEPQQLGPRLVASRAQARAAGRKLEGISVETAGVEGTEEEEAKAAMLAMTVAAAVALSVAAVAVALAIRRRVLPAELALGLTAKAGGAAEPLEAVSVQGGGDSPPQEQPSSD